eukprot:1178659-Prorocentrum_minimum.AAC.1
MRSVLSVTSPRPSVTCPRSSVNFLRPSANAPSHATSQQVYVYACLTSKCAAPNIDLPTPARQCAFEAAASHARWRALKTKVLVLSFRRAEQVNLRPKRADTRGRGSLRYRQRDLLREFGPLRFDMCGVWLLGCGCDVRT